MEAFSNEDAVPILVRRSFFIPMGSVALPKDQIAAKVQGEK